MISTLRIATRKSPLALWQAEFARSQLVMHHRELQVDLVPISTRGDEILDAPLWNVGGKGLFVKELEIAMLEGRVDIAVHSLKDVPMILPDGLKLGAIFRRDDPLDAFVANDYTSLDGMPSGGIVGTSSLRRRCQLLARYPRLVVRDLRGNVNTRLMRLDDGDYDALILASAGLRRLQMGDRIADRLSAEFMLPAAGQGVMAIECRSDEPHLDDLLAPLNHNDSATCVIAERAVMRSLGGGCQLPVAAYAELQDNSDDLCIRAMVGRPDGTELLSQEIIGSRQSPESLGEQLAFELIAAGAAEIIAMSDE